MSRHEVKIKIVTSMGNTPFYRSTMWLIHEFQNTQNFETKIIEKLHAKIYVADGRFAIHGSANLTDAGVKSNLEQIAVTENQHEVNELQNIFEQIWRTGIESKPEFKFDSKNIFSKKEKAITEAKEFIQNNHQRFSNKQEMMDHVSKTLVANYHFGEERTQNYLKIVITDLKINHNFDVNKIFKKS